MRIMTRRANEGFVIGNEIHVTVLEIKDDSVRLGFSSPKAELPYWEEELKLAIDEDREAIDAGQTLLKTVG